MDPSASFLHQSSGPAAQKEPSHWPAAPSLTPASQAQILRAHQRDTSQIRRLIDLTSEVLRSIAGTRWLAQRLTIVDLLVRAVYLGLTFGRGAQTLGEEYTDILPCAPAHRRLPSRKRRFVTILFLLLPSILNPPSAVAHLRASSAPSAESSTSPWTKARLRLATFLESPVGRHLPELHMIAFMFSGRFFEFAKRLTGISYISTLPARPPGYETPTFEPLGLMMLAPLLFRLITQRRQAVATDSSSLVVPIIAPVGSLSLSPPLIPPLRAEETVILTKSASYDTPNTYLTKDALSLPRRQCTLCLEPRGTGEGSGGTVAVTECGHVFCWGCLGGLEKPECPLCRQTLRMERLIAAYNL